MSLSLYVKLKVLTSAYTSLFSGMVSLLPSITKPITRYLVKGLQMNKYAELSLDRKNKRESKGNQLLCNFVLLSAYT